MGTQGKNIKSQPAQNIDCGNRWPQKATHDRDDEECWQLDKKVR